MNKSPMTTNGARKLREELRQLKTCERPRIADAIAQARGMGDLRENAEYHAAREQQSFIERRIAEIEGKLSRAQIIDVRKVDANGKIVFGATVALYNLETQDELICQIVGEDEADIKAGMVSVQSPLARALIGKEAGDVVVVDAPAGEVEYEILKVRYE